MLKKKEKIICRRLIPFIIVVIFVLSSQLYSQENESENVPGTAFYLEMGGKWFYSANIDFPINRSNRFSLGVSPVYGDIVPTVIYHHLGGEKSRFEIGCGIGYIIILTEDVEHEEFKGLTLHGVIGYRYQKKNGFLFRAGFTPIFFFDKFLPWVGISFGYSL